MSAQTVTEQDLFRLLRGRYPADQYALLPQVRNGTGYTKVTRTADAISIGLWPSRGMLVEGFEIKVSRADWRRELAAPEKADEIAAFCDRWWVLAPPDVVPVADLPPAWGLLVPKGKGLSVAKAAEKLEAKQPHRLFLAAVLRKAASIVTPDAIIAAAEQRARAEERDRAKESAVQSEEFLRQTVAGLEQRISEFEKASGVSISRWDGANVGLAVRAVLDGPHRQRQAMRNLADQAARILAQAEQAVAAFDESTTVTDA